MQPKLQKFGDLQCSTLMCPSVELLHTEEKGCLMEKKNTAVSGRIIFIVQHLSACSCGFAAPPSLIVTEGTKGTPKTSEIGRAGMQKRKVWRKSEQEGDMPRPREAFSASAMRYQITVRTKSPPKDRPGRKAQDVSIRSLHGDAI